MVNAYIQTLLDAPLKPTSETPDGLKEFSRRVSKVWLPEGRLPPRERSEEEKLASLARSRAARVHAKQEDESKIAKLYDYYATTEVPIARIVANLKREKSEVIQELHKRGRKA